MKLFAAVLLLGVVLTLGRFASLISAAPPSSDSPSSDTTARPTVATAPSSETAAPPSSVTATSPCAPDFLKPGHTYYFRFAPGANVFQTTVSSSAPGYFKLPDGTQEPSGSITMKVGYFVEAFRVKRFGGGSWVLLEHPAEHFDYPKWNFKYRAAAELADDHAVAELEKTDAGRERLAKLRELAQQEFKTTGTWINLAYVVAIGDMPQGLPEFEVKSVASP